MDGGDLSDVSVLAHLLQNRLAAVSGAASTLREHPDLSAEHREQLLDIVERSARGLSPVITLLQRGMPAMALLEMQQPQAGLLPAMSSGATPTVPVPDDDEARVEALRSYEVLDRPALPELERIARLAADAAGVELAFVNLIDAERQWQAAASGPDRIEVPRCDAMCAVTVARGETIVVPDATQDPRFATSPWVVGPLGEVRFYVSVPLRSVVDGHAIGTICAVDDQRRDLAPVAVERLEDLASLAMSILEARRAAMTLRAVLEAQA